MKEKSCESGCPAAGRRSADEIRRDIKAERETIAHTVDTLGGKLQNALDWKAYVREAPFVSVGVAAGLGAAVAALLKKRRAPMDRIVEAASRSSRRAGSRSLLSAGVYTLITKALADLAKTAVSDIAQGGARAQGPVGAQPPETVH
jgi:ElaB/YqjD/DUF883 family membrane-anchored ribosome-binding protein